MNRTEALLTLQKSLPTIVSDTRTTAAYVVSLYMYVHTCQGTKFFELLSTAHIVNSKGAI